VIALHASWPDLARGDAEAAEGHSGVANDAIFPLTKNSAFSASPREHFTSLSDAE